MQSDPQVPGSNPAPGEPVHNERSPGAASTGPPMNKHTIPDLPGSDPYQPNVEQRDETAHMPNIVPLNTLKIPEPATEKQIRELTRSRIATLVVVVVLGSNIAFVLAHVDPDASMFAISAGSGALAIVLVHYFRKSPRK